MAGFKKINGANPTVRRPLRMSDIQDLWDGLAALLTPYGDSYQPYIVSGFTPDDDGSEPALNFGVVVYGGRLYFCEDHTKVGDTLKLCEVPDATRVFSDGQPQVFSYSCIATNSEAVNVIHEFEITEDWLTNFRLIKDVGDGSITTSKLADNAVTPVKIQAGAAMRSYGGNHYFPSENAAVQLPARDAFYRFRGQDSRELYFQVPAIPENRSATYEFIFTNYGSNVISLSCNVNYNGVDAGAVLELQPETTGSVRVVASNGNSPDLIAYSQQISVNPL